MLSEKLLAVAFDRSVRQGTLEVTLARGRRFTFGNGGLPKVVIRFTDTAAQRALSINPELAIGELYMDGRLVIEEGSIYDLLQLLLQHGCIFIIGSALL